MTAKEFIALLDEQYPPSASIDSYIRSGAKEFWNRTTHNQNIDPPSNLERFNQQYVIDYYNRCFQTAYLSCKPVIGSTTISYKELKKGDYEAWTRRIGDEHIIILDATLYASAIVYFTCVYLLSFADITAPQRDLIEKVLLSEVDDCLSFLHAKTIDRDIVAFDWLDVAAIDHDILLWASISAECALSFVIFHEIGHCALNHQLSPTNDKDLFDSFNKDLETQADSFALQQYNALVENPAPDVPFLPTSDFKGIPWLYFKLLNAINRRSNRLYGTNSYSSAYPSFDKRAATVESLIMDNTILIDKSLNIINAIIN